MCQEIKKRIRNQLPQERQEQQQGEKKILNWQVRTMKLADGLNIEFKTFLENMATTLTGHTLQKGFLT